jgi:hypothetical protein
MSVPIAFLSGAYPQAIDDWNLKRSEESYSTACVRPTWEAEGERFSADCAHPFRDGRESLPCFDGLPLSPHSIAARECFRQIAGMWISKTKDELSNRLATLPRPIVLVPTMGALHPGHASLIELARDKAGSDGSVVVSIFVNPIQFDRAGDLNSYPRPIMADLTICEAYGADGVFLPADGEMYFADRSVTVFESSLSAHLCGAARPGHFDGVCTVVLKLFNLSAMRRFSGKRISSSSRSSAA